MKIPNAELSPRMENGSLLWYEGDTFDFTIPISIRDDDGEIVELGTDDTLYIEFRNQQNQAVYSYTFSGIENSSVTVSFNEELTALFPAGNYTYDIVLNHGRRQTVVKNAQCIVS